jgi:uncharacterized protein (TIGR03437 family)
VSAARFPLPAELNGLLVTIGGQRARLLAAVPLAGDGLQINAQVPRLANLNSEPIPLTVEYFGRTLAGMGAARLDSPGEFFRQPDGSGIFLRASAGYTLVTNTNPAQPGEVLAAYLTGLPPATPMPGDGEPAAVEPLSRVPEYALAAATEEFVVLIDGVPGKPHFLGLAPGLAGVYQLNFTLPAARSAATVMLERRSCRAAFGSCLNGGGVTRVTCSAAVRLPVAE